jgi:septal ring factor EnvC (AmiA/AmiB activator)
MKRSLGLLLGLLPAIELFSCAPHSQQTYYQRYKVDEGKILLAKEKWKAERQLRFYIKQVALQVKDLKKAIEELNRQLIKQNEINENFATDIYVLKRKIAKIERELNAIKGYSQVKKVYKEVKELRRETKKLKDQIQPESGSSENKTGGGNK